MNNLMRSLFKIQNLTRKKPNQSVSGFTMIELMVGAILAFLIITPMMGFVISILEDDNREGLKAITDQEVNTAVDYIAEDLSQARYIYDNDGLTLIEDQLPESTNPDYTPILVFWKRRRLPESLPVANIAKPKDCNDQDRDYDCSDAYVDALVAYYLVANDQNNIWCNPTSDADKCPSRIMRAEIRGALRNPRTGQEYLEADLKDNQKKTQGFLGLQDAPNQGDPQTWQKSQNETYPVNLTDVLVNYIDSSTGQDVLNLPPGQADYCQKVLGSPTLPATTQVKPENTLKINTASNSFVACVDSDRNIAHITIRGNALRRKSSDADYDANKSSFFPTATLKVQGQSTPIKRN
jgi:hypothetical protein